jgi:WD40-like Beta Propeller Repeat
MGLRLMWVCCMIGCGNVQANHPSVDAATPTDALFDADLKIDGPSSDTNRVCDPTGKFDAPLPVMEIAISGLSEFTPRLSADELTMYLGTATASGQLALYVAHRARPTDAFGMPIVLPADASTNQNTHDPSVSSDGLTLWLATGRVPNEGIHIYVSTRTSTLAAFGPAGLAAINSDNKAVFDTQPFETADAEELWFASTRQPSLGADDIWRATRTSGGFSVPIQEVQLSSSFRDTQPMLSADRLTVYLSSTRPAPGARGGSDIWMAHRSTVSDGFPLPTLVEELNTDANDSASWLSADGCRLYGSTDTAIFMATRLPL